MATRQTMFAYRANLDEIVEDLLDRYHRDDDRPPDHKCDTHGLACRHHRFDHAPLVARLRELSLPSQSMLRDTAGGKKVSKGTTGSPAPWSAAAAELIDEIYRGSLDLVAHARRVLDFGELHVRVEVLPYLAGGPLCEECRHTSCTAARHRWVPASTLSVDEAGRVALRQLPELSSVLRSRAAAGHHLPRWIEQRMRAWHRRAQLLTGHEVRWARLGQVPNPNNPGMYPDDASSGWQMGPTCEQVGCGHLTCRVLRRGRREKWTEARCPYCDSTSLRQDPLSGDVWCLRPSCTDSEGRRHIWTVDELERLGLIMITETAS